MTKNYQKNSQLNENQAQTAQKYEIDFKADYISDWDIHSNYVNQNFDAYEAMLLGQVYDSVSGAVDNSKITDSYASTLVRERADRVMAKLPDGQTISAGKADLGKAAFMDLLRQKWIYPNANAQRPFKDKLNLWQLYSSVYGYMPMFYDWNTAASGYVGPDCWLWNPRNLIPQQGKISIEDMDYVTALTWVSKKRLENILEQAKKDQSGWDVNALQELISMCDSVGTSGNDTEKDTYTERQRTPQGTKKGICLATRYEAGEDGKWCTFAPDHGYMKLRDLPNPHKNGRIPFIIKYSQPTFDSFYGMGDFQRAKPLQFARDGLTNFYFASLKRNLAPGIIVNANGVVKHTLDVTKSNPVLMETIPNSIRPFPTNTAGLSTYQGAMSNLTGSLLSQFGTQNASMPGAETLNPEQGKTPAAIKMYSGKEATRDGAEQRHLETAIEQLLDGFFSLIANIGTEDIPINLFAKDIEEIVEAGLEDVLGMFTQKFTPDQQLPAGQLRIDPKTLKGVEYRFNIESGSTMKISKAEQLQELERYISGLAAFTNLFKDDPRVQIHPDEIARVWGDLTDIHGAEKFMTVAEGPSPAELELQQQLEQKDQELQQLQAELQQKDQEMQAAADQQNKPVVSKTGTMFSDPEIAQVADQLSQL